MAFSASDIKNVKWVMVSNFLNLILGLIISFLLPKYVGISTYANYRIYTLYIDYVGLFHFGLTNGIYLRYGKYEYEELPKNKFREYTSFLVVCQLVEIIIMTLLGITVGRESFSKSPYLFILLNIFSINFIAYFSLINQFTKRFQIDAIIQILYKFLMAGFICGLLLVKCDNYLFYLVGISLTNYIVLGIYALKNIELVWPIRFFGPDIREIISLIKKGFFVMISEFMGLIILGIDSIFLIIAFDDYSYSMYTFAISVVVLALRIISLSSNLFFPYLKRVDRSKYAYYYKIMSCTVLLVSLFLVLGFFIARGILPYALFKYSDSGPIMAILGISVIFRSFLELVANNFYKTMNLERDFAINNIIALVLGVISDSIAYIVWHDINAIAYASIISFYLWYLITDKYFRRKLAIRKFPLMIVVTVIFLVYILCINVGLLMGSTIYIILCFVMFGVAIVIKNRKMLV